MATSRLTNVSTPLPIVDALLKDIARRIQLSPTDYGVAVDHYEAVCDWLGREASPLKTVFRRLYPQGSMAIGATIASRLRNDEFDIDVIAELDLRPDAPPGAVLDLLFKTMNGDSGSRYNGKVKRRTRCVTVEYDRMHLDITPAVRLSHLGERTSVIFHAHEDEPPEKHRHIIANPWGFADWFENMTPAAREVVEAVLRKSADPVPDQEEIFDKSMPLIALQLLKRWRNKCYDRRDGRSPPSVVLAYFVARSAGRARDLYAELRQQARALHAEFAAADARSQLVSVVNPACGTDVLTDRWPGDLSTQRVFLSDLSGLVAALEEIEADPTVETCAEVMSDLFGENPTRVVVEDFRKSFERKAHAGGLFTRGGTGGLAVGASGLASSAAAERSYPIKRHTDFGSDG